VNNAFPANIIVVANTNDSGSGSLRDALAMANDGDTIDATGVSGTILLTSGELQINHSVTINGLGAGNLAANGNATSRVFENFAANVTIAGFTITNGFITDVNGGGILNHGGLTVTNSVISGNQARDEATCTAIGGGLSADSGTVTVSNSEINGNQVMGGGPLCVSSGGGIGISGGGTLTVTNSSISDNSAGGIRFGGATLTVTNSVISGNTEAFSGGGIEALGETVTVSNSTISGNQFFCDGGGIAFDGVTLTVVNSTISGNISPAAAAHQQRLGVAPNRMGAAASVGGR
jgi:parallel beta helix pectate lyase-like protein